LNDRPPEAATGTGCSSLETVSWPDLLARRRYSESALPDKA
jgi:hypothetical protein